MMLRLAGVLLSCGALCLAYPRLPAVRKGCATSSLIQETLSDVQTLQSKGSRGITPPKSITEAGGNITIYLEGFIEVLKRSKEGSKERLLACKLQRIQDARKSCPGWTESNMVPEEQYDFFRNLEDLLRFLNHNAPLEETP